MDEKQEFQRRRQAIRLWLKGIKPNRILEKVQRSRVWLSKWRKRFNQFGIAGLRSDSRRPHHTPTTYPPRIVRWIIQTRRRLVKRPVGLNGARAIRRELRQVLGSQTPSLATINRVLQTHGLTSHTVLTRPAYCPKPLSTVRGTLQALDWTCRYLEAGPKVYAFHTLNLRTRACHQTIATDKSTPTVIQHCLDTWKTLGIPQFLQLDNDAAFCGGYKAPRIFGQFVRVCLYLGIEPIFLPVAEPERNGEVEEVNGLWGRAFWERRRFASLGRVRQASPAFVQWYMTNYAPPHLIELTPQQAQRRERRRCLTATQIAQLPEVLPITAGRIHFVRKVQVDGHVVILNETWKVSKRLAGKYIWATLVTHRRRLDIWYQRSAQHEWQLLKTYRYDIPEPVARLRPEFAHSKAA
jgi:hypothetical protein